MVNQKFFFKLKKLKFFFLIQDLKDVMANIIPAEQKRVAAFRKEHGSFKIGEVTVDMVSNQPTQQTFNYGFE